MCKCKNLRSPMDLCDSCRKDYEAYLEEQDLQFVLDKNAVETFRRSLTESPRGEAIREYFDQFKTTKGE